MNCLDNTIKLSLKNSPLYREIENYLAEHIHPGFSEPFTLKGLVPPGEDNTATLSYFINLVLDGNPIHHSTVDKKWYNNLKKICLPYSIFPNLPVKYSSSV